MAIMNNEQLIGLNVITKSGTPLGTVSRFEVDVDHQNIVRYIVDRRKWNAWHTDELIVSRTQVISIDLDKIVVVDALVQEEATREVRRGLSPLPVSSPSTYTTPSVSDPKAPSTT